jgi:hypothetical protein
MIELVAIFAAAVVASFVTGQTELDASCLPNGAILSAVSSSLPPAKSTTRAITFPAANRSAKGDRWRIPIPNDEIGAAINRSTKDGDSGSVRSRPIREGERKPVQHCEPVGSPPASPTVLYLPPRSCIAQVEPVPRYIVLGATAQAS